MSDQLSRPRGQFRALFLKWFAVQKLACVRYLGNILSRWSHTYAVAPGNFVDPSVGNPGSLCVGLV
jgi:hypothetical protein